MRTPFSRSGAEYCLSAIAIAAYQRSSLIFESPAPFAGPGGDEIIAGRGRCCGRII